MSYNAIRNELNEFYFGRLPAIAENVHKTVFEKMDAYAKEHPTDNAYKLKAKQYEVIADTIEPVVYEDIPFFFETGALVAFSDGRFSRGAEHANGWLYLRNSHLFKDTDPYAYDLYNAHKENDLYQQCGIYADMMHQGLPLKKVFKVGLKGILQELYEAQKSCKTEQESDFIACCIAGICSICRIGEKFADAAKEKGLEKLSLLAKKVPFNPPQTVHEGLCVLAFMRKALGSVEGMGFSSFGRVDVLLAPLYEKDMLRGVSKDELLDLVTKFLLIWDCTFDRNAKLELGNEFELENSLTLGGCDEDGNPVFNGITKLFLEARNNENILYPKMMLRFCENSPKEYLEMIGAPLLNGKSFSLYANDSSLIPALISSGIEKKDAFNYAVGGCWDVLIPDVYIHNGGESFNLLTPLHWSIYNKKDSMYETNVFFESLENTQSFDELYSRYLGGIRRIGVQKATLQSHGVKVWSKVNPAAALSALMEPCIPIKKDITAGAGKYNNETIYFTLFAEAVDSLLAIKSLCFDKKVCSVSELFEQCRTDWTNEVLRQRAIHAPKYGDGSDASSEFVGKFVDDLYSIFYDLPTAYGGHFRLGANYYTQIVNKRNHIPSLPNGRKKGDFLSQGITPSRTQNDVSLFNILDSTRCIDTNKFAANASMSLTLPAGNLDSERIVEFFKMASRSGISSIQPNCVKREDLLQAQKNPENYTHIIVRVCGFSAPFVALPKIYQDEILTRTLSEV